MQWQVTLLLETAVAVLIIGVVLVLLAARWVRGYHRRTLILLRSVAFHMIQNRPPTDDATRLQQTLDWWEREVMSILPRAGAKPREIARFGAVGNIYHPTIIANKIARLDAIIDRLEG